jgi:hypothetical protein
LSEYKVATQWLEKQPSVRVASLWLKRAISERYVEEVWQDVDPYVLPFDHLFSGKRRIVVDPEEYGGIADEPDGLITGTVSEFLKDSGVLEEGDKIDWKKGKLLNSEGRVKSRLGKAFNKATRETLKKDKEWYEPLQNLKKKIEGHNPGYTERNLRELLQVASYIKGEPMSGVYASMAVEANFGFLLSDQWSRIEEEISKLFTMSEEELKKIAQKASLDKINNFDITAPAGYLDNLFRVRFGKPSARSERYYKQPFEHLSEVYREHGDEIDNLIEKIDKVPLPRKKLLRELPELKKRMDQYADWKGDHGKDLVMVVSRDPVDVLRMSDHPHAVKAIESCHSEGGSEFQCAIAEAKEGGLIAYVVAKDDLKGVDLDAPEIFEDRSRGLKGLKPYSRLRLRRFEDPLRRNEVAIPEDRTYGSDISGFQDALRQWALEEQDHPNLSKDPKDYYLTGGEYKDTESSELFDLFFPEVSRDNYDPEHDPDAVRRPDYDPDDDYEDEDEDGESSHGERTLYPSGYEFGKPDFWQYMTERHPEVRNPNPKGRKDKITPNTLKGYLRGNSPFAAQARSIVSPYLLEYEKVLKQQQEQEAARKRKEDRAKWMNPETRKSWIEKIKEHGAKSPIPGQGPDFDTPGVFPRMWQDKLEVDHRGNPLVQAADPEARNTGQRSQIEHEGISDKAYIHQGAHVGKDAKVGEATIWNGARVYGGDVQKGVVGEGAEIRGGKILGGEFGGRGYGRRANVTISGGNWDEYTLEAMRAHPDYKKNFIDNSLARGRWDSVPKEIQEKATYFRAQDGEGDDFSNDYDTLKHYSIDG